ncbi:MAG: GNAT family N-acetyltransferase [Clostridia bacterium]|nr:GNAT family N-acetyltransferase [Clostridia bacterium]
MPLFSTLSPIQSVFSRIPELRTERLVLRKLTPRDAGDMFEYARSEEVTRFLTWYPHPDVSHTRAYLKALRSAYRKGRFFDWGVEFQGKMIGTCGFTNISEENSCGEIGYVLSPAFRGRGLMTEAAKRVVDFGFDDLGLERIEAKHIVGNEKSASLMRRCGMSCEGTLRNAMLIKGQFRTICIYSILREDRDRLRNAE